jgi:hypothetical protein
MIDREILKDSTIRRVVAGCCAGPVLGLLLAGVLAVIHDPVVTPVVFFGAIAVFVLAIWRWSEGLA